MIGDAAVGKTSLVATFITGEFPTEHIPTVFDAHEGTVYINEQARKIKVWDTAGQLDQN